MNKVVFFRVPEKLEEALDYFNLEGFAHQQVPLKLHMGEVKNKYFTKPDFVKRVVGALVQRQVKPYLFDTTVAYQGLRHTVKGYQKVAHMHGFTVENIGCDVVIENRGKPITVEGKMYEVAEHLVNSMHLFAISHVKGHVATGMGGAIKNFGMGGVTKETKRQMHHGSRPIFQNDSCTFCGVCAEVCPFDAITVDNNTWCCDKRSCFGCGVCVENCENEILVYEEKDFQYVLACAAQACVSEKNVIYLNDVNRIAKSCDCDPSADPVICPDIGFLISDDIIAVDKASLDLVQQVKGNVFEMENHVNPYKQIKYGEEIGLGSSRYQLIEL